MSFLSILRSFEPIAPSSEKPWKICEPIVQSTATTDALYMKDCERVYVSNFI